MLAAEKGAAPDPLLRSKHLAFAIHRGSIICHATNMSVLNYPYRRGPIKKDINSRMSIHAEEAVSLKLLKMRGVIFNECTLVVLRTGSLPPYSYMQSKPCKYCQILIKNLGYKKVIYTDDRGNFVSLY